jgi:SAM-dependent methyltransferase
MSRRAAVRKLAAVVVALAAGTLVLLRGAAPPRAPLVQPLAAELTTADDPRRETPDDPIWTMRWADPDAPEREGGWQERRVFEVLAARPGMRIADVGAGAGWFTFRLAKAVSPGGAVWALDTDPRMARRLAFEKTRRGLDLVRVFQNDHTRLGLPGEAFDAVLMVNVGYIANRDGDPAYYASLVDEAADALGPGGRLVIAEHFHANAKRLDGAGTAAVLERRFELVSLEEEPPDGGPVALTGFLLVARRK